MKLKSTIESKGSELVAEIGDWGLYKSTLTLTFSPESGKNNININNININHMRLLRAGDDDDYIDFDIANKISRLNKKLLIQLVKKNKIRARKLDGKLFISLNSLIDFLSNNIHKD
jgi:hypothetical protein